MNDASPQDILSTLLAREGAERLFAEFWTYSSTSGDEALFICPQSNKPKLSVNINTGLWQSFTSGETGDYFTVLMSRGMSFPEAKKYAADRAGIALNGAAADPHAWKRYQERASLIETVVGFCQRQLFMAAGQDTLRYLHERGYSDRQITGMGLGVYPDQDKLRDALRRKEYDDRVIEASGLLSLSQFGDTHTLLIPLHDGQGRIVSFGCRVTDPSIEPKYLYPKSTPEFKRGDHLFGLHLVRRSAEVMVVEGWLDAALLNHEGIPAVGCGSGALSDHHLQMLRRCKVECLLLCMDNSDTGRGFTRKLILQAPRAGLSCAVIPLPDGVKDPDELIRKSGVDAMYQQLMAPVSGGSWLGADLMQDVDFANPAKRGPTIRKATQAYAQMLQREPLEAEEMAVAAAAQCGALKDTVLATIKSGGVVNLDDALSLEQDIEYGWAEVTKYVDHAEQLMDGLVVRPPVLPTGVRQLDMKIEGFYEEDFVVIGGQSGSGKTSFACCYMPCYQALKGHKVGVVSLDMGRARFLNYLAKTFAGMAGASVTLAELRNPQPSDWTRATFQTIRCAASEYSNKLYVVTRGRRDIKSCVQYARILVEKYGCDMLVFDQAEAVTEWNARGATVDSRSEVVSDFCFKVARDLNTATALLAQGNRVSRRRPTDIGLSDCDALRKRPDILLMLHDEQNALINSPRERGEITGMIKDSKSLRWRVARENDNQNLVCMKPEASRPLSIYLAKSRASEVEWMDFQFDFSRGVAVQ